MTLVGRYNLKTKSSVNIHQRSHQANAKVIFQNCDIFPTSFRITKLCAIEIEPPSVPGPKCLLTTFEQISLNFNCVSFSLRCPSIQSRCVQVLCLSNIRVSLLQLFLKSSRSIRHLLKTSLKFFQEGFRIVQKTSSLVEQSVVGRHVAGQAVKNNLLLLVLQHGDLIDIVHSCVPEAGSCGCEQIGSIFKI